MTVLPPLNGLRAFDVAGRRLNFRAAADDMGVTQGAVAQQVRQLEAYLGVALFDRRPKGLVLTAAGQGYHDRIAAAFADLRSATAALRPEPGKVLISVTPTFAAKWLIPNLPDFSTKHPDVDLRILATEKVSSFHSDGIDLAIRQGTPPFGAALNTALLFQQDVIAVAAPKLLHDKGVSPDRAALPHLPKIHDTHDLWPQMLMQMGLRDHTTRGLRLSQTALAVDAAISGQGVALVSRFLVSSDIAAGNLVTISGAGIAGAQHFYLLTQRRPVPNPAIETVVAWLTSQAAKGD